MSRITNLKVQWEFSWKHDHLQPTKISFLKEMAASALRFHWTRFSNSALSRHPHTKSPWISQVGMGNPTLEVSIKREGDNQTKIVALTGSGHEEGELSCCRPWYLKLRGYGRWLWVGNSWRSADGVWVGLAVVCEGEGLSRDAVQSTLWSCYIFQWNWSLEL